MLAILKNLLMLLRNEVLLEQGWLFVLQLRGMLGFQEPEGPEQGCGHKVVAGKQGYGVKGRGSGGLGGRVRLGWEGVPRAASRQVR